jgi:VWFA-related protein
VLAAQQDARVRITSPTDDAYVTGAVRLVAVVDPAGAAASVTEVRFFVGARQVCVVKAAPFACDWDAGDRLVAHQVRVAASLRDGRRLVHSVTTKEAEYVEAVDVDVVQVTAVVVDRNGDYVRGLDRSDFRVLDDGKAQKLTHFASENVPLELVAAIDASSSMREALPAVKDAAKRFLDGLQPRDEVTVLGFNDNIFTLARRSTDSAVRARAVDRLGSWGGTALHDVIIKATDVLGRQAGRRSILLFTDGDDQSSHATMEAAITRTEGSDATIYAIGHGRAIVARELQLLLQRLTDTSGGRLFVAADASKLEPVFAQILEELRNQYLLAYPTPSGVRDGEWHTIEVQIPGKDYRIRARKGYRLTKR